MRVAIRADQAGNVDTVASDLTYHIGQDGEACDCLARALASVTTIIAKNAPITALAAIVLGWIMDGSGNWPGELL
jgi:hypothetical protein